MKLAFRREGSGAAARVPSRRAALDQEQAGRFSGDEELAELVARELPFYFARYGEQQRADHAMIRDEVPNGDALRLFNEEIFETFDLRAALARISAPTLVITGGRDFGHFVFVEARKRFREEVARWLA